MDFTEFFNKYEALIQEVDRAFQQVKDAHPECVKCEVGCCDCCHAVFDLSLVEAMYLNHKFNEQYEGPERSKIMDRADEADRQAYKMKKQLFKASEEGMDTKELLEQAGRMRVRCPLLDDEDKCVLYDHRPITCRLYGIPIAIYGQGHTCGKSGFDAGKQYPTVHLEKIQDKLMAVSQELVKSLNTQYAQLAEVLVPVSMALLNKYDEKELGIVREGQGPGQTKKGMTSWSLEDGKVTKEEFDGCATCPSSSGDCSPSTCGIDPKTGEQA